MAPEFDELAQGGGREVKIPFWKDLSAPAPERFSRLRVPVPNCSAIHPTVIVVNAPARYCGRFS